MLPSELRRLAQAILLSLYWFFTSASPPLLVPRSIPTQSLVRSRSVCLFVLSGLSHSGLLGQHGWMRAALDRNVVFVVLGSARDADDHEGRTRRRIRIAEIGERDLPSDA